MKTYLMRTEEFERILDELVKQCIERAFTHLKSTNEIFSDYQKTKNKLLNDIEIKYDKKIN